MTTICSLSLSVGPDSLLITHSNRQLGTATQPKPSVSFATGKASILDTDVLVDHANTANTWPSCGPVAPWAPTLRQGQPQRPNQTRNPPCPASCTSCLPCYAPRHTACPMLSLAALWRSTLPLVQEKKKSPRILCICPFSNSHPGWLTVRPAAWLQWDICKAAGAGARTAFAVNSVIPVHHHVATPVSERPKKAFLDKNRLCCIVAAASRKLLRHPRDSSLPCHFRHRGSTWSPTSLAPISAHSCATKPLSKVLGRP